MCRVSPGIKPTVSSRSVTVVCSRVFSICNCCVCSLSLNCHYLSGMHVPCSQKYWWELIEFEFGPKITISKIYCSGGFKFGSFVWDCHTYLVFTEADGQPAKFSGYKRFPCDLED